MFEVIIIETPHIQTVKLWAVKANGMYSYQCALRGYFSYAFTQLSGTSFIFAIHLFKHILCSHCNQHPSVCRPATTAFFFSPINLEHL
jgi:hypothetical protein